MKFLFILLFLMSCNGNTESSLAIETKSDPLTSFGIASAFIKNGSVVEILASGVRKVGFETQVSSQDKFHLGSCTKAMTATLVAILIEEGKLSWTTTMKELFPHLTIHPLLQSTTIETLLVHRAGFPEGHEVMQKVWNSNPVQGRSLITETLLKEPPRTNPDTSFIYSNYSYIIVGHALERITGEAWEDLITNKLFAPMGMSSCGFGTTSDPIELSPSAPWGHERMNGILIPKQFDNPKAFGPAGTVHCSLTDWGKFLNMHSEGFNGVDNLLKKESYSKLHANHPKNDSTYTYGGWNRLTRKWAGGTVLHHTGSNTLNFANVWIAPMKNSVIISTTNIGGNEAFSATDAAIGNMIERHL